MPITIRNKKRIWKKISDQVDKLTDRLGMPVDKDIKTVVVGLNLNAIPTVSSCGGHISKERLLFPWIICQSGGRPKYRFVGEKKIMETIARKYKIDQDKIFWPGNEDAEKEYYGSTKNAPETSEYIEWDKGNILIEKKVKDILAEFYDSKNHTKGVKIALGQIYPGCLIEIPDKNEKRWERTLSGKNFKSKIRESQKEMKFFGEFLFKKFFETGN